MNNYEKAARMVFLRKGRFIEGYDPNEELLSLITKFFGDKKLLDKHGVNHFFTSLKNYTLFNDIIGLILMGKNSKTYGNHIISSYKIKDRPDVNLNIKTICSILLDEYFTKEEIKNCCFSTPNFKIYYKE